MKNINLFLKRNVAGELVFWKDRVSKTIDQKIS